MTSMQSHHYHETLTPVIFLYRIMGSLSTTDLLFEQRRVVQSPCPRMRSFLEWKGVYIPNDLNGENYAHLREY